VFVEDNPEASLDDVLAHFGVLGMKWGHRKVADSSDIRAARARLMVQQSRYEKATKAVRKSSTPQGKAAAKAKVAHIKASFLKNPDRVTATRMTRGEKAVSVLISGPFSVIPIATTSAISRRIEYKQDNGKYNKP
jgi:hypothetical protein